MVLLFILVLPIILILPDKDISNSDRLKGGKHSAILVIFEMIDQNEQLFSNILCLSSSSLVARDAWIHIFSDILHHIDCLFVIIFPLFHLVEDSRDTSS
jgi:hypothetical protein